MANFFKGQIESSFKFSVKSVNNFDLKYWLLL
jgi:hypothetical protein